MRHLLAPFMLLSVAAGSAISAAAFAALLGPNALTGDPAVFQVVSSTPQSVQLDPAGQKLRLSATNSETGQRIEERFDLDRLAVGSSGLKGIKPAEDENLHLYQISPDELDRYVRVQDEILGWHEHRVSPRQLVSLTVLPAGCIKADTEHQGRLSAFWLSMDGGDSFTPLERQIDPLQLAANAGETETVQSC